MSSSPIFVSGVYRSGTTLPVKILNTNSSLCFTHDTINFFRYYLENEVPLEKRYEEVVADIEDRLKSRFSIEVPVEKILEKIRSSEEQLSFAFIYNVIMTEVFCQGDYSKKWGEKSLIQWTKIPLFLEMFPRSKAFVIIRDPRNVVASFRDFTIEPGKRYLDAIFACHHVMNWTITIGQSLKNYRTIYYEKVVGNPEKWAKDMCSFIDVDYEEGMSDSNKFTDHVGDKWVSNTSFADIDSGISVNTLERWKDRLSRDELLLTEYILGDLMQKHGYKLSGIKPERGEMDRILEDVSECDLIKERIRNWKETGMGVESYPSDPTNPSNWSKTTRPKDI